MFGLFEGWKDRVGAEIPSGDWRRRRKQGNGGEEADADPSSPEGFGDEGEEERVRVKDEPLDYSEMDFDQSEVLAALCALFNLGLCVYTFFSPSCFQY